MPALAMRAVGFEAGYWLALKWAKGPGFAASTSGSDSWRPMGEALDYLASHPAQGLYQVTYFESSAQFIYPPLSLVFARLTNWPPLIDWSSPASLNAVSWWIVLATVGLVALMFLEAPRWLGGTAPGAIDRPVRLATAAAIAMLFYPILRGLQVGQIQVWLNFLLILSIWSWMRGHRVAVGIALGLFCVFKPHLAIVVVWLALQREFRVIVGMLLVGTAFAAASIWSYGLPVHLEYVELLGHLSRRGESYYASHSINSLLNRMFFLGNNLEWDGTHTRLAYNPLIHLATIVSSLGLIAAGLMFPRGETPPQKLLGFCAALLAFSLAAPVIYEHHYALTLPMFLVVLVGYCALPVSRPGELLLLLLAYALSANILGIADLTAASYANVLQSYRLIGGLILLVLMFRLRRHMHRELSLLRRTA